MTSQTTTKWWTLGVVSVATFMLLLDITVVNTALPAIEEDLHASFTDLQWVVDAYTLTLAAAVLTAGSLADRLGRRRVFAIGLGIFSIASLVAGLATRSNLPEHRPRRAGRRRRRDVRRLPGADRPGVPAGRERGMAMGVYGATIGLAVAFGPLVGGVVVDSLGWEWIFFLNVPIGVAAIAITYLRVRESRDPNATRVDWAGLVTFSSSLFLLVLALIRGNEEGWGSSLIVGLFAASAVLLVAFLAIERRVAEPMLPLGLFKRPAFTGVQLAAFGISGSMFALFLYLTLYLQNFLGLSPTEAGLRYLPLTVAVFLVAPISGALLSRVQARVLISLGLVGGRRRPPADGGRGCHGRLDRPARRLHRRGRGDRPAQPRDRRRGPERGAEGAERNGVGNQRHVPPGRHRGGRRGLGSDLPGQRGREGRVAHGTRRRPVSGISSRASPRGTSTRRSRQVPAGSRAQVADAAREGFLAGFNLISVLGAFLAFAAAIGAFWLVRERDIERGEVEVVEAEAERAPQALPEPVAA